MSAAYSWSGAEVPVIDALAAFHAGLSIGIFFGGSIAGYALVFWYGGHGEAEGTMSVSDVIKVSALGWFKGLYILLICCTQDADVHLNVPLQSTFPVFVALNTAGMSQNYFPDVEKGGAAVKVILFAAAVAPNTSDTRQSTRKN